MFDVEKTTTELIQWIRNWFDTNGKDCNAVIGISGGKDSTIVAALCVEALGKDRVIGIMMPNGYQKDIEDSIKVCNILGIKNYTVDISPMISALKLSILNSAVAISKQTYINIPPRVRMTTLYAFSQSLNGRVANTCNLSETMVGYETRWGDSVGDFSPLGNLTVEEILQIGDYLKLPYELVHKTPIDGLDTKADGSYVTDEDNLGVSYAEIDAYIRCEPISDEALRIIQKKVKNSAFKRKPIPTYGKN